MQEDLENWTARARPTPEKLQGAHIELKAYKSEDAEALWNCFGGTEFNGLARYFPNDDFSNAGDLRNWLDAAQCEWHTMVFRDMASSQCVGMASYMRIDEKNGSVEVGAVCHAKPLQRTRAATEAHYLMAKHVFDDLGYRRYEWKLNNENEASHRAAKRFGFSYEGLFRNHIVAKGKNRDTAWYAMTNHDWPKIKHGFEAWLDPSNFDGNGSQIKSLEECRNRFSL